MSAAISVERLSKSYVLGGRRGGYVALRDVIAEAFRRPFIKNRGQESADAAGKKPFFALEDVSFAVERGERVGIIGRNGAGKSTLLKMLSRITAPTAGRIALAGRVTSLLEVGTGFHPELTGRENIYLNGAILGMTRREITGRFDEIVAFAEIEQFLDTPVKRYSSGMYVRLAFAVAANLEPEILLIDEVLAVGDFAFRAKCIGRMGEIGKSGRTILFVSHDMAQIQSLCSRVLLLEDGRLTKDGAPAEVIGRYISRSTASVAVPNPHRRGSVPDHFAPGPKIEEASLVDERGNHRSVFSSRERFAVRLRLRPFPGSDKLFAAVWFLHDQAGRQIAVGASSPIDTVLFPQTATWICCEFNPAALLAGVYTLRFVLHIPRYDNFDDWPAALRFEIADSDVKKSGYSYPGIWTADLFIDHQWKSGEETV
jgi:lipopolysaccharide transport system ATP-binding protein